MEVHATHQPSSQRPHAGAIVLDPARHGGAALQPSTIWRSWVRPRPTTFQRQDMHATAPSSGSPAMHRLNGRTLNSRPQKFTDRMNRMIVFFLVKINAREPFIPATNDPAFTVLHHAARLTSLADRRRRRAQLSIRFRGSAVISILQSGAEPRTYASPRPTESRKRRHIQ